MPNHRRDRSSSTSRMILTLIHRIQSIPISLKISALLLAGIILGCVLPKDPNLPTVSVRYASSIIGYTYFLCWSISFYPQVILNYTRKTTSGLSPEFSILNVVGFGCYSIYVGCFFFSPTIRNEYASRFGGDGDNAVQSNDVAFAFHALLLSTVQVCQIIYYDHWGDHGGAFKFPLATWAKYFLIGSAIVCVSYAVLVATGFHGILWLDYLYMLSIIKLVITFIKYIPQLILNYRRKSTVGWNVWNVLLDFAGGILSLAQLLLDAMDMNDYTAITGNFVKFGLSFVAISFDIAFITQHFVLYPSSTSEEGDQSLPLLD